jgi:hypothetical protein
MTSVIFLAGQPFQGIEVLEAALHSSPSAVVVAEPYLFNLCA